MAVGLVEIDLAGLEGDGLDGGEVIWASALVVEGHGAVALEVAGLVGGAGGVDGELLVVGADAVAVGVWVGEEAGLEDGVGGGLDAGDQVGGGEGDLFDFGEVVDGVLVEGEFADFGQWELLLWPDVGEVENVDLLGLPQVFGFFGGHRLDGDIPFGELAALDGFVEVFLRVVGAL